MWILPILSQELHKVCTLMHCKTNNVFLRMSAYNAHTRMQTRTHVRACAHTYTHSHGNHHYSDYYQRLKKTS